MLILHGTLYRNVTTRHHLPSMKPSLFINATSAIALVTVALLQHATAEDVAFQQQVRPLLAKHCFQCHGPDAHEREAGLRLDQADAAMAILESTARAIVPGAPEKSEAFLRITSDDPDLRMPPDNGQHQLSEREISLLRKWMEQGAPWDTHWAFRPYQREEAPNVANANWPVNAIDNFVLARLEQANLAPSPPADLATLARRASFDLTGLPPEPEEIDALMRRQSANAYEEYVDRLLASPRYGERMASLWLDAARYADTNGYQHDNGRDMWPWRDWVIRAYNDNMPFDRFTIDQLAGDLLPNPTVDQRVATGFHRNHELNFEGGSIDEESRVGYVLDRTNTTGTIWLGMTIGCAQCHSHKYDPISQEDYYRLYAFFNNVDERGFAGEHGNAEPTIPVPWPGHDDRVVRLERRWKKLDDRVSQLESQRDDAQVQWESDAVQGRTDLPQAPQDAVVRYSFEHDGDSVIDSTQGGHDGLIHGTSLRAEGRIGQALSLDGETRVEIGDVAGFKREDSFSYGCWVWAKGNQVSPLVSRVHFHGYDVCWKYGHIQAHLVNRWDINAIFVRTKRQFPNDQWHHVMVTYDGSSRAEGVAIYVNGQRQEVDIEKDCLTGTIETESPLHIGARNGETDGRLDGRIDEVQIFARELSDVEVALLASQSPIRDIVHTPHEQRSADARLLLRQFFLRWFNDEYNELRQSRKQAKLEYLAQREKSLTSMVMKDRVRMRPTHRLIAGRYDRPGQQVTPGVPSVFPDLPAGAKPDRLTLARWLVDPRHPLTARVTVNRYWQAFFGHGIVRTVDDFGVQGEPPTHPRLLDWLASEFIRTGWDVKAMHKLMVTSATYRQASRTSPELVRHDPGNRFLTRAVRFRLPAEMIRDAALKQSGLLVERVGGPSVMPYQPDGLWRDLSFMSGHTAQIYKIGEGEDLYRRSLYTFWKRTCPPPRMQIFDVPERMACQVQRSNTNTPLQALVLMNDPTFVESARALAARSVLAYPDAPQEQINHAFRRVVGRRPELHELQILQELMVRQKEGFAAEPGRAETLLNVGESRFDLPVRPIDLAALTMVTHVILSMDEAISRN